jgi:hypothetical protein
VKEQLQRVRTHLDLPTLGDPSVVLMSHTRQENTFLCQPQQRNTAGRIFGAWTGNPVCTSECLPTQRRQRVCAHRWLHHAARVRARLRHVVRVWRQPTHVSAPMP